MPSSPTSVLVVGATGGIGRRVVAAAQQHGLDVRALVRDPARAERLLPGADLVSGDLEKPDTLRTAVSDVDAVVFTHGGDGSPDAARRIDYGGGAGVLRAAPAGADDLDRRQPARRRQHRPAAGLEAALRAAGPR